jgi:DHA1 family bicyclomycin/chloramphenicol resistance-like MFS transporter
VTVSDIEPSTGEQSTSVRGTASGREFIILVTALMASGALAIDLMLPAFPDMRAEYGMSPDSTQVAWIVTAFFLGMAVGPWLYGPASDRYGRRAPLFVGMTIYILAALAATFAPSWGWVIASRFVWGLGAAAPRSLATAMIRDRYHGEAMARLMSTIMAVFLLVPILAPSVGAGLIVFLPWRVVFWFPAVVGVGLMLWCRRLPETLPVDKRRPFTWSAVARAGKEVVTHRQTISFTVAVTFLFGIMTGYLAGSEVIVEDVYDLGAWFPLFFGVIAILLALNSLNNARIVKKIGIKRIVKRMMFIGLGASAVFVVIAFASGGKPPFWLLMVCFAGVVPVAQGLAPICNTAAMTPVPHVAGTASALIATVTTAGGSLLGGVASGAFDGTVRPLAVAFLSFNLVAAFLVIVATRSMSDDRTTH